MDDPEQKSTVHKTVIGPRTACLLYGALVAASFAFLTGTPRTFALVIVGGLAVKSYIDYLRQRMD
jgi:hypothetical protein